MSQPTSQCPKSLSQAQQLARSITAVDPQKTDALENLGRHIQELRHTLKDEDAHVENGLCELAERIVDQLARHGQISPRQGLSMVAEVLVHVVEALGGELASEEQPTAIRKREELGEPTLGLRLMDQRRLGEILVSLHMLSQDQVERALKHQKAMGKRFGETLIELGLLNKGSIESALRMQRRNQGSRSLDPWMQKG